MENDKKRRNFREFRGEIYRVLRRMVGFMIYLGLGSTLALSIMVHYNLVECDNSYVVIPGYIILLILGCFFWCYCWINEKNLWEERLEKRFDEYEKDLEESHKKHVL